MVSNMPLPHIDYPWNSKLPSTLNGFLSKLSRSQTGSFVSQQFTGLLDKNGKEIYEGDILQLYRPKQKLEVVWNEGCFILNDSSGLFLYQEHKTSEIIGNIFENPELLK